MRVNENNTQILKKAAKVIWFDQIDEKYGHFGVFENFLSIIWPYLDSHFPGKSITITTEKISEENESLKKPIRVLMI